MSEVINNNGFKYRINKDCGIFDERGNQILAIREVVWGENADNEDAKGKLELRKWFIEEDGTEKPHKGFTFLTDDGPHLLAEKMVENGYGNTNRLIDNIIKRDDYDPKYIAKQSLKDGASTAIGKVIDTIID